MKAREAGLVLVCVYLIVSQCGCSLPRMSGANQDGEKLVRQLWVNMKKSDMVTIEKMTARGFQSVHQYGANNREQEIELIKGLKLGEYTLSGFQITQNGPVIVATYLVSVKETIKGKRLSKRPAPRLSVFLKTDTGWQWIAHANLKPLE